MRAPGVRRRIAGVRLFAVLSGCALVLASAACGGSSGGGSGSGSGTTATTTTTTTTGTTGTSGGGKGGRLSAADWTSYEATATNAKTVNQKAIVTFKKCRGLVTAHQSANTIKACFGGTTANVVNTGKTVLTDLQGYISRSGDGCQTALNSLYADAKLYVSSVNALNLAASQGNVPQIQNVNSTIAQLTNARTAAAKVAPVCQPA
jgi:hypothetical protein